MKRICYILSLLVLPVLAEAQLGGLARKIKNKTTQKIDQRVDAKVEKQLDKTLDDIEGKNNSAGKTEQAPPLIAGTNNSNSNTDSGKTAFSRYDFIPGEKIIYAEDFSQEATGELPLHWNTNGSGEVVTLEKHEGTWLRMHTPFIYLSANKKIWPENFTAEFDLLLQLKNNGWMYPSFSVGFLSTSREPAGSNAWLKKIDTYEAVKATLYPEENENSRVLLETFSDEKEYFKSDAKKFAGLQQFYGRPVHIAIQIQKERFRMWINATKIFDAPQALACHYALNQLFFKIGQTNYAEEQYGIYISNIRLASGIPDTRHKLVEEGRFSTTGILFGVNSAVIRPESAGVLKEIAEVLKENSAISIRIIGHTSSEGEDKYNLELSAKRAAAVKEILVKEYGIEAARLQTEGRGEKEPVSDNTSKEGKAANRRVEFIKL
jgi:outer membrane protein OmpA-like peptidoglycan-associated protein